MNSFFKKSKYNFKVIMITNYYYPQTGGITTVIEKITEILRKHNVKTKILAYPQLFRKVERLFLNIDFVHKILVILFIIYTTLYILFNRIFNKNIIVHSHSANFCAIAGLMSKIVGCKTVHTFHTHLDMAKNLGESYPKPYLDKIDQLTAVSNFLGVSYYKKYHLKNKIKIIYNGVDINNNVVKKKVDGKIKILFVGHLFEIKDPMLFIKTIEYLSKKRKVEARIIGEGDLMNKIVKYIKKNNLNNIELLGGVEKNVVESNYKWADVLVMTSKGEGLPLVILEAMSFGTPVVSTLAGGTSEIIENKREGMVIKKRTPESVSKAILFALKNVNEFNENAKKKIEYKFNWKFIVGEYLNVYENILFKK